MVLETLRPQADVILGADDNGFMEATMITETAAHALLKREKLSDEDYDVLVIPLLEAGVPRDVLYP